MSEEDKQVDNDKMDDGQIEELTKLFGKMNINDKKEIMKEKSLKRAHYYCLINNKTSQQFGPLLEHYIITKHGFTKVSASLRSGDCSKDGKNYEIKVSLGGKTHDKFNYVQIRPSHKIDHYVLTAYHLSHKNIPEGGKLYIMNVSKDNMIDIIEEFGSYAHGTKKKYGEITKELILENKDIEYALRPSFGDKCWKKLMEYEISVNEL